MPIYVGDTTDGRRATVLASTGSTWFGNSSDDLHNIQGLMYVTGTLHVNGDVSGDYVTVIDNDENSAGHGLKVTSDGSGTGTNIFDVESGTTTVFRVRADGKVAIGETSQGGIPTQVEALTVNGDLSFRDYLKRRGDSNTYIGMPANDQMELVAGGVTFVSITENASQDKIVFNDGGADVDFIVESPNESTAIYLNAGNEVLHINHGQSSFRTKIHNTNDEVLTVTDAGAVFNDDSHADIDFRIESDNNTHMFFVDAGNEKIGINTSAPDKDLEINNSSGGAIRLTYNDSNGSATDYADISVGANGALTLATTDSDGLAGDLTLDADGDIYLNADNGTVVFADATTSYMTISNSSSNSFIRSLVADKDIRFATTDSNIVATVDSSDDAFKIDRKLGLGSDTLMNSSGELNTNVPFNKIVNTTGSDITGTLLDPTFDGQLKIIAGLKQSTGESIVSYTNAAGGTTTKTLTSGVPIILISFDASGAGAYRWMPVGDVS